jgi:hypothetical protein
MSQRCCYHVHRFSFTSTLAAGALPMWNVLTNFNGHYAFSSILIHMRIHTHSHSLIIHSLLSSGAAPATHHSAHHHGPLLPQQPAPFRAATSSVAQPSAARAAGAAAAPALGRPRRRLPHLLHLARLAQVRGLALPRHQQHHRAVRPRQHSKQQQQQQQQRAKQ